MQLHYVLAMCLLAHAAFAVPSTSRHQLVRVFATSRGQLDDLTSIQGVSMDFWNDPQINGFTDVMVSKEEGKVFTEALESFGINYKVAMDDIEAVIQSQSDERASIMSGRGSQGMSWDNYQTYQTIYAWLDKLDNGKTVKVTNIGKTFEGRDIKAVQITADVNGDNSDKPTVLFTSGIHACEWIAPVTTTYAINQLANNASYADLLNQYNIYVIPLINVDGYALTWEQMIPFRLHRRSMSKYPSQDYRTVICPGVDLNRNFGYKWGGAITGNASSNNPCDAIILSSYRGTSAFSEPETRAVRDFVESLDNRCMYANFHSYSQKIMYPWGWTNAPTPDEDRFKAVAEQAKNAVFAVYGTQYTTGASSKDLYFTDGTDQDWVYGEGLFPWSFTMEVRDTGTYGFLLPANQAEPTAIETFEAMKVFIDQC